MRGRFPLRRRRQAGLRLPAAAQGLGRRGARAWSAATAPALDRLDAALWTFDPLRLRPARAGAGAATPPPAPRAHADLAGRRRVAACAARERAAQPGRRRMVDGCERFARVIEIVSADAADADAGRQRWRAVRERSAQSGLELVHHARAADTDDAARRRADADRGHRHRARGAGGGRSRCRCRPSRCRSSRSARHAGRPGRGADRRRCSRPCDRASTRMLEARLRAALAPLLARLADAVVATCAASWPRAAGPGRAGRRRRPGAAAQALSARSSGGRAQRVALQRAGRTCDLLVRLPRASTPQIPDAVAVRFWSIVAPVEKYPSHTRLNIPTGGFACKSR